MQVTGLNFRHLRRALKGVAANFAHHLQLTRLRIDRLKSKRLHPDRPRILAATFCSFSANFQTFIYEELTQLIRSGFELRFVYSKRNPLRNLSSQFFPLWHSRRKIILNASVCREDYAHFAGRMPEKIDKLVDMVSQASGKSAEEIRNHHHFLEAFAFTRMVQAYRPDYLHCYLFCEGPLFTLFASYLLDIPRGLTCYSEQMASDDNLKTLPLHLRQCSLVVADSQQTKQELLRIAPGANPNSMVVKTNHVPDQTFHTRLSKVLVPNAGNGYKPLVSIITPFLNAESFLQEAIESVLAQTYENWELFLVDDGSADASTASAQRYAQEYAGKVFYLEHRDHRNRGATASRNLGLQHIKGTYVAFLDADDVWLPLKLERQVAILQLQHQAMMVYGATQYWYSWTGNPQDMERDYIPDLVVEAETMYEPPSLLSLLHPFGEGTAPCPSDLLMRREVVEQIGGFEESFQGMNQLYEDQAFLVKVYLKHPVFVSSECWDRYRIHDQSCMAIVARAGQNNAVRRYFLDWLEAYLSKNGFKDTPVWSTLQTALVALQNNGNLISETPAAGQPAEQNTPFRETQWGALRRLTPVSRNWGFDRGLPIDRYYIENFLARHASDIQGRVLEFQDDRYTRRFGDNRVTIRDVLHVSEGNPLATIIGDLTNANHIGSDTFQCIIFTQSLQYIYNVEAAVQTLYRILRPGGVLLATLPGITRTGNTKWPESWFWRFTSSSARHLFQGVFSEKNVQVQAHGNVLASVAFLYGLAVEDLRSDELDYQDPDYEVLITVRAVKSIAT